MDKANTIIAFDNLRESVRSKDEFGRLHISRAKIAHSSIDRYSVSDIPNAHKRLPHLASDASEVRIMRDADSLKAAAARYARVPLYLTHTTELEGLDKSRIIGTVGSDVSTAFDADTKTTSVYADLCVWDADAITAIEQGSINQLSASYSFDLDPTHSTLDDAKYDAIMRVKTPNHVALVQHARGGPTLRIGDSQMSTDKVITQVDIDAAVKAGIDAYKAQVANDAKPGLTQVDVDAAVKAGIDAYKAQVANDAKPGLTQADVDAAVKAASDAANARHAAAVETRATLGDVALDSADAYYSKALDVLKVDHTGVSGVANLAALYKLGLSKNAVATSATSRVASDSAPGVKLATGVKFNMSHIERA